MASKKITGFSRLFQQGNAGNIGKRRIKANQKKASSKEIKEQEEIR